jgi:hypothetical protein
MTIDVTILGQGAAELLGAYWYILRHAQEGIKLGDKEAKDYEALYRRFAARLSDSAREMYDLSDSCYEAAHAMTRPDALRFIAGLVDDHIVDANKKVQPATAEQVKIKPNICANCARERVCIIPMKHQMTRCDDLELTATGQTIPAPAEQGEGPNLDWLEALLSIYRVWTSQYQYEIDRKRAELAKEIYTRLASRPQPEAPTAEGYQALVDRQIRELRDFAARRDAAQVKE